MGHDLDPRKLASQHQITPGAIDEAVDDVLEDFGIAKDNADVLRKLMANDHSSEVARAYYGGAASAGLQRAHLRAARKTLTISYELTESEVAMLVAYSPEYKLAFKNVDVHDHGLAAAYRTIDQVLVESRVPPGARYSDVGASVMRHVKQGHDDVHMCVTFADPKDPQREVLTGLQLKKVESDPSAMPSVRELAKKAIQRDKQLICGKRAQDCCYKTPVVISVHVYDIPMADWPTIMENKGAKLVEGCMLFSPRILEQKRGNFPAAGVRFEVDRDADRFSMGFINSPSWWYSHSWREYARYGADQLLYGKTGVFSYKIVERRGDTIFFRILRVGGRPREMPEQHYKLPGVAMVRVIGFDVNSGKSAKTSPAKEWHWPRPLWEDMVSHAQERFEKKTLTADSMFNFYRSVAPRQTINSVVTFGGHSVHMDELVALVVMSSVTAIVESLTTNETVRAMLDQEVAQRMGSAESTIFKVVSSLSNITWVGYRYSFGLLTDWIRNKAGKLGSVELAEAMRVEWTPVVEMRVLPMELVMSKTWRAAFGFTPSAFHKGFSEEVRTAAPFDHVTAAAGDPDMAEVVMDLFGDALPQHVQLSLQASVDKKNEMESARVAELAASENVGTSHQGSTKVDSVTGTADDTPLANERRSAILEAITEVEMEQIQISAECRKTYAELTTSGVPNEGACRSGKEVYRSPEFWWLNQGLFEKSLLGTTLEEFDHMAVYIPHHSGKIGGNVQPVQSELFEGMSEGRMVCREYFKLTDSTFTGWALVTDSLRVYNGPEIVQSLRQALNMQVEFDVVLCEGPPGCGKTTKIVSSVQQGDGVFCPMRVSVRETRDRIRTKRKGLKFNVRRDCGTLDSFLVNWGRDKKVTAMRFLRVFIDEAFAAHAGKWYALCALLGVRTVFAYGDRQQIPHVPRAVLASMHARIKCQREDTTFLSYRCPQDAVAAIGDLYGWKIRSASEVKVSLHQGTLEAAADFPDGCVMLGMYQSDKKEIHRMYSSSGKKFKVMTVHESQGNTFKDVWMHRFDARRRSDGSSLYDKPNYVNVGMSRHTSTFLYRLPSGLEDEVTRRITQGKSIRRMVAAAEQATAGESKEFG